MGWVGLGEEKWTHVHLSVGLAGVGACVQRGWAGLGCEPAGTGAR